MTPEQKNLVKSSFAELTPDSAAFTDRFYARLFARDPAVRALFQGDMQEQGRKFTEMMHLILDSLERLDAVVPVLWQLGKRHGGYGVQAEHYDTVREALLWALAQQLGARFTPEMHAAWIEIWDMMATTMQQAAAEGILPRREKPGKARR
jgi:hemoglobin-like flavoprotein